MTNVTDFTFLSTDGKTMLHARRWDPAEAPVRAVLQISHGVAEYIGRYDLFARFLNDHGIAVVGNDHLGHGESVPAGATPVYFGQGNTWNTVVDDLYSLHQQIEAMYPNVPLFLMGHSMGSFIARTYLIRYPGTVKAAIIMGTGWQSAFTTSAGLALAKFIANKSGEDSSSEFVTNLAFGSYNKPFAPIRTEFDWLSVDTENVDRYIADPLCGQPTTVGLFREMLGGFRFIQNAENLKKMNPSTPIFFISGEMDPVGSLGKGVRQAYNAFKSAGVQDLSIKLYPQLRHEILNEKAQQKAIFSDLFEWLNTKI